jgi:hypothetical protein
MKSKIWFLGALVCLLLLLAASRAGAQPAPSSQDPLMNLMLSQPKIDISSPATATVEFEPPVVRPGDEAVYRVNFNALEESVAWPEEPPTVPGLEFQPGGHGEIFQMGGGVMQPRTSFNYHVRAGAPGEFVVPEFSVKVYGKPVTVPAARLQVTSTPPASVVPARRLRVEVPGTNLYAGQPVRARVIYAGPPGSPVQGLAQVQLTGQGFIVDQSAVQQRISNVPRGRTSAPAYVYETTLTPLTAGPVSIMAQGFLAGLHTSGPVVITAPGGSQPITIGGGPPQYTLLDSDPLEISVRPLPRRGELPGFTGAIGTFAIDPPSLDTDSVQAGDPVKLTVTVRGDDASQRVVPPPPPAPGRDWQIFAAMDASGSPASPTSRRFGAPGSSKPVCASFSYTLIPLTTEARATPAIPFSYFDPGRGAYVDLTIPPVTLTVKGGVASADARALTQREPADAETEKEPTLSGLASAPGLATDSLVPVQQRAWFPLLQLAPGAAFLGLWGWDRRRRYLERHPEVVLKRRALRGLRREWRGARQAARAGDTSRFAARAAGALRVACSPHYPAEPRALVGADVLALFPENERAGRVGEVIRRFFAVSDAARFGSAAGQADGLLALKPELDSLLARLEERLRA